MEFNGKIRIELESETVVENNTARVLVFENDKLAAEVMAKIEKGLGADYGIYDFISLRIK